MEHPWERILAEAEKYAMQRNDLNALAGEGQSDFELEDWNDNFDRPRRTYRIHTLQTCNIFTCDGNISGSDIGAVHL